MARNQYSHRNSKEKVLKLRKKGLKIREIAKKLDINESSVKYHLYPAVRASHEKYQARLNSENRMKIVLFYIKDFTPEQRKIIVEVCRKMARLCWCCNKFVEKITMTKDGSPICYDCKKL